MKRSMILFLILSFSLLFGGSKAVVKGTLTDQDGNQFKQANILIYSLITNQVVKNIPLKSKNYKVEIDKKGVYEIRYCAPFHLAQSVTVMVKDNLEETVNVKMVPFEKAENFDQLAVVFKSEKFGDVNSVMHKETDGKYHATFKSDEKRVDYQLLGVEAKGHSVNGTEGEFTGPDDAGDYFSTLKSDKGVYNFTFDPSLLPAPKGKTEIKFLNENSVTAALNKLKSKSDFYMEDYYKKMTVFVKAGNNRKDFKYDSKELEQFFQKYINSEDVEIQKVGLAFYLVSERILTNKNKEYRKKYFAMVKPESDLWSLTPFVFINNFGVEKDPELVKYYKEFFAKNKNKEVKAQRLSMEYAIAKYGGKKEEMKKIRKELKDKYSDSRSYQFFQKRYPENPAISVGKKLPEFEIIDITDETKTYTNESFKGKVLLVDFWATWCGPCKGEMEHLHKAYEKFKDKGFEILSLSFDRSPENVTKYRAGKWKMPWCHSFVKGGFSNKMANDFEVVGIPKPILVGKDGKIIEVDKLRGDNLLTTIEKHLK